jgi:hypothetical protein
MHDLAARLLILLAIALPSGAVHTDESSTDMNVTENSNASSTTKEYSDEIFRQLVARYAVDDGAKIDYAAWQASPDDLAALDGQIALIGRISPKSHPNLFPTRAAERRYWINTYNALVLDAVLEYWPLDSVKDVKLSFTSRIVPGKGFFHDRKVVVGGETSNLLKLEKDLLRSQKDPRLHFALNCASDSCPVLRPSDWSEEELERATRDFINDPANIAVVGETVYVSKIFKWFRKISQKIFTATSCSTPTPNSKLPCRRQ